MKKLVFIVVFVVMVAAYFVFFKKAEEFTYVTKELETSDIIEKVTATGIIDPISTINIGTQVSGTIQKIFVDYNSKVEADQLLAIIEPATFLAKVKQQEANLKSAKAKLNVIKSQVEYNRKNLNRIKKLNKSAYSSEKELDIVQKDYDVSKAELELQSATIEQIEASLDLANTEYGYSKIISPVNGIIISKDVEVGQTVAASFQTPTLFQVAEDLSKMQINASVVETDVTKVRNGQKVQFTVDGYGEKIFIGKVIQVRNNPTTVQNVVSYEVIIEIENNEHLFKPGMTANVEIITAMKKNILVSDNKALRFYVADEENQTRYQDRGLWVLDDNNEPTRISIIIGVSDDEKTEIISNHPKIKSGQKVILERISNIENKKKKTLRPKGGRR